MHNRVSQFFKGLYESTKGRVRKRLKTYGDKGLIEDNDSLTYSLTKAMNLIDFQQNVIDGLNRAMGEIESAQQKELCQRDNVILALLIHCGGEAVISESVCSLVRDSTDQIKMEEVGDDLCFSIIPNETEE